MQEGIDVWQRIASAIKVANLRDPSIPFVRINIVIMEALAPMARRSLLPLEVQVTLQTLISDHWEVICNSVPEDCPRLLTRQRAWDAVLDSNSRLNQLRRIEFLLEARKAAAVIAARHSCNTGSDLYPSDAFFPYVKSDKLAHAAEAGRVYREKVGSRWQYSWSDACREWPHEVPATPPIPQSSENIAPV